MLALQAPGSAHRCCQDLLNVKSKALWCHPTTIWGHSGSQITQRNLLQFFNYPPIMQEVTLTFCTACLPQFAQSAICSFLWQLLFFAPDRSGPSLPWNSSSPLSIACLGRTSQAAFVFQSSGLYFPLTVNSPRAEARPPGSHRVGWLPFPNPHDSQHLSGVPVISTSC